MKDTVPQLKRWTIPEIYLHPMEGIALVKMITSLVAIAVIVSGGLCVMYYTQPGTPPEKKSQKPPKQRYILLENFLAEDIRKAVIMLAVDETWKRASRYSSNRKEKEVHFYNKRMRIFCAYRIKSSKLQVARFEPPVREFSTAPFENILLDNEKVYVSGNSFFELQSGRKSVLFRLQFR